MMKTDRIVAFILLLCATLSGCKEVTESEPTYELAHQCVAIKSHDSDKFFVRSSDGYRLEMAAVDAAETFYLQPTGLGTFLLYDRAGKFMGRRNNQPVVVDAPSPTTEWMINWVTLGASADSTPEGVTLVATTVPKRLTYHEKDLRMRSTKIHPVKLDESVFELVHLPKNQCRAYPEAVLNAEVDPDFYQPKPASDPVKGFADVHIHIGFPKTMGSVVMSGDIFHPYGVEHALKDCDGLHGRDGVLDLLESQETPSRRHSTRGYPHFDYWPNKETHTHIYTYYRWIERAYLAGLRLMVTHATGNPYYCQIMGMIHVNQFEGDCSASETVRRQTEYVYQLQDYIDAQAGGPGKGWFRIATSSEQAREFINQNKLAVVLGSEYSALFDCRSSNSHCDEAYINQELDKLYDMGIRSVFPIHRFDNAFGGTQPGGVSWMHLSSKLNTGKVNHLTDLINPWGSLFDASIGGNFYDMEACPGHVQGDHTVPSMRNFLDNEFVITQSDLADVPAIGNVLAKGFNAVFLNKLEPIPDYAHLQHLTSACNARHLQQPGQYLVDRLIDKGMIVEIDHMSYNTTDEAMQILEQRNYSGVISSHGMVRGGDAMRDRIFRLGGLAVKFSGRPRQVIDNIQQTKAVMAPYEFLVGIGFGTDAQGVAGQAAGEEGFVPTYPFDSYDGLVKFQQPKIGHREIDFSQEGNAHYGMLAEWVENFRLESEALNDDSFEIFMNSAEAYLQMWARAESAAIQ